MVTQTVLWRHDQIKQRRGACSLWLERQLAVGLLPAIGQDDGATAAGCAAVATLFCIPKSLIPLHSLIDY